MLEYDPPRRLSYTFKPMHDELYSGEQPPRVVFSISSNRTQIKSPHSTTILPTGKVFGSISNGWPLVLSSLKSYLEANRVLYAPWYEN